MQVICFCQGRTKEEGWTTSIHENEDNVNHEADENRKEDLVDMDKLLNS
jgi:hypothetical protein